MTNPNSTIRARVATGGVILIAGQALEALKTRLTNASLARKLGVKKILIRSQLFIAGIEYITIGENFDAGRGLWLEAVTRHRAQVFNPKIVIGENVSVSFWCHIAAVDSVIIGNNVMVGSKVLIIDHNHGSYGPVVHDNPAIPPVTRNLAFSPIVIGDNVWIGDGVVITPGSNIGDGCVIGANAVVTGAIAPNSIAVGVPARVIKQFDFSSKQWIAAK